MVAARTWAGDSDEGRIRGGRAEPTEPAGEHRHVKSSTVAGHATAAEMARLRRASGVGVHRVRVDAASGRADANRAVWEQGVLAAA